jgi:translation elongation factor EF-1alpha
MKSTVGPQCGWFHVVRGHPLGTRMCMTLRNQMDSVLYSQARFARVNAEFKKHLIFCQLRILEKKMMYVEGFVQHD